MVEAVWGRGGDTGSWVTECRFILNEKLIQRSLDLSLGQRFTFQQLNSAEVLMWTLAWSQSNKSLERPKKSLCLLRLLSGAGVCNLLPVCSIQAMISWLRTCCSLVLELLDRNTLLFVVVFICLVFFLVRFLWFFSVVSSTYSRNPLCWQHVIYLRMVPFCCCSD